MNAGDYVPMWVAFVWTTACYSLCGWANFSVTDKTERHSLSYKAPLDLALLTTLTSFLATLSIIHLVSITLPFLLFLGTSQDLSHVGFPLVWNDLPQIFPQPVSTHHLGFSSDATSSDGPFFATQYNNENSHMSNESAANTY